MPTQSWRGKSAVIRIYIALWRPTATANPYSPLDDRGISDYYKTCFFLFFFTININFGNKNIYKFKFKFFINKESSIRNMHVWKNAQMTRTNKRIKQGNTWGGDNIYYVPFGVYTLAIQCFSFKRKSYLWLAHLFTIVRFSGIPQQAPVVASA